MISHRAQKPERETTPGTFFSLLSYVPSLLYLFPHLSDLFVCLCFFFFPASPSHLPVCDIHMYDFGVLAISTVLMFFLCIPLHYFFYEHGSSEKFFLIFFLVQWQHLYQVICSVALVYIYSDACKLQVKALQMSPRHRNVKIIQDSLCRQSRRPIWTSFNLAKRGAVLAGSVYQSFKFIGTGRQALCAVCLFLCLFFDPDLQFISLTSFTQSF